MSMEYEERNTDSEKKQKYSEKSLSQCQFLHHKLNRTVRGEAWHGAKGLWHSLRCIFGVYLPGAIKEYNDERISPACP
jgi:hypothetical protein